MKRKFILRVVIIFSFLMTGYPEVNITNLRYPEVNKTNLRYPEVNITIRIIPEVNLIDKVTVDIVPLSIPLICPLLENCECDASCAFYGDCCKGFYFPLHENIQRNQSKQSFTFDHYECRSLPGKEEGVRILSNCRERIGYWMISKCPERTSEELKTKCEKEHTRDELVQLRYIAPANDESGNVYKNYFCAVCHNVPPDEIKTWITVEICNSCRGGLWLHQDNFTSMDNGDCHVSVTKPSSTRLRSCYKDMVRSCPIDSNVNDSEMCLQFSSPGYFDDVYYKNIFCARCHGLESSLNWFREKFTHGRCSPPTDEGQFVLTDAIGFMDSLCSLIRCYRPMNLCSGSERSSSLYLSLTINDNIRCLHLNERAERCFFKESQLENAMLPWKKMTGSNPMWSKGKNENHSVIIYQLPSQQSNATDWRIQFDKDLVKTANRLIQLKQSCYLWNIELVEVCGSEKEWKRLGECNEDLVETHGDEILERENNFLNELSLNFSYSLVPSWYSVHTKFKLDSFATVEKRTLVCFTPPEIKESAMWQRVFCGLCIALTVLLHLATFLTYATFKSLRNTFGISLMCFVMSLAIALCLLVFVSNYIKHIRYLYETVAVVSHYFWLASFCWVNVLAWDLHVTLSPSKMRVRQASSLKRLAAYCCFCWGLPLVIVAVYVTLWMIDLPRFPVIYGSVEGTPCWIHDYRMKLIAVAGPLLGCIFVTICLSLMIWRSLYIYKKDCAVMQRDIHNRKRRMLELLVYIKVSMLMGFSWIFGFLADFTKVEALNWLFYLSYLIQAFLIFVFFGLSGKVRNLWKESRAARSSTIFTPDHTAGERGAPMGKETKSYNTSNF